MRMYLGLLVMDFVMTRQIMKIALLCTQCHFKHTFRFRKDFFQNQKSAVLSGFSALCQDSSLPIKQDAMKQSKQHA